MKFNFEKFSLSDKKPEPEKNEKTQEEFESEIEIQAEKLKISLEELAEEINAVGGEEKFKELMEKKESGQHPKGLKFLQDNESYLASDKREFKKQAIQATVAAVVACLMTILGIADGETIAAYPGIMALIAGTITTISAFKKRREIKSRTHNYEKEKLKMKMTGVEFYDKPVE